jgi:hypothetical protein
MSDGENTEIEDFRALVESHGGIERATSGADIVAEQIPDIAWNLWNTIQQAQIEIENAQEQLTEATEELSTLLGL